MLRGTRPLATKYRAKVPGPKSAQVRGQFMKRRSLSESKPPQKECWKKKSGTPSAGPISICVYNCVCVYIHQPWPSMAI